MTAAPPPFSCEVGFWVFLVVVWIWNVPIGPPIGSLLSDSGVILKVGSVPLQVVPGPHLTPSLLLSTVGKPLLTTCSHHHVYGPWSIFSRLSCFLCSVRHSYTHVASTLTFLFLFSIMLTLIFIPYSLPDCEDIKGLSTRGSLLSILSQEKC